MPDQFQLDNATLLSDNNGPIYARLCDECGFVEASADPLLVLEHRECPNCAVRRYLHL